MKSKINITIPTPCHENWQAMSTSEKGRFCTTCQKNVYDFTTASDRQIVAAYEKDANLCGRFLNTQLNRDLVVPKEKSTIWLATTSAIISFLALGSQEAIAQGGVKIEQTNKKVLLGEPAVIENQEKIITGITSDLMGPLPGVNIVVKGTQRGVQTEFDGKYSIKAKEGETLVFSFMGMKDQEVKVDSSNVFNITLKDDDTVLQGGAFFFKRKSFIGRQLYRIRNWFR